MPTDLRAELVDDPDLASGFAVRLTWQDNADNETCFGVAVRLHGALWGVIGLSPGLDGSTTGPMTLDYVPVFAGPLCYQVYYGNAAGQSYSNEVCIDVGVQPVLKTATPTVPTADTPMPSPPAPTPPPWPCHPLDDPTYSELAPSPPTDLTATLVADPTASGGLRVRLVWQDNASDELCYKAQRVELDGRWQWFATGNGNTEVDSQPSPGVRCYRVAVVNEHGRSAWSNEACATGEATTPAPAATGVAVAVPRALPTTGGRPAEGGLGWRWSTLAAAGAVLLGLAALSLVGMARRRPLSR